MRELFQGIPLFVKVFIAAVFTMTFAGFMVIAFMIYTMFGVVTNPEKIGAYVGKIQSGYEREAGK